MTTRLRIETPQDMAAAAPIVLGFQPESDVVLFGLRGDQPFNARLDLPPSRSYFEAAAHALLEPAYRHGLTLVAFLFYTPVVRGVPSQFSNYLYRAFMDAGIEVLDTVRVHDGWVWPMPPSRSIPSGGVKLPETHPFKAQAVSDGRVVLGSRDALKTRVLPVPVLVEQFTPHLEASAPVSARDLAGLLEVAFRAGELQLAPAAALLSSMDSKEFSDLFMSTLDRSNAGQAVRFFSWLVQRTPEDQSHTVLFVVALSAWLVGDGALSWISVDRCLELKPDSRIARLVSELLQNAVPPSAWEQIKNGSSK